MTVSSTNAFSGPYVANGSTTVFPFSFKVMTESEVRVVIVEDGEIEEQSASLYTVSIVGEGGSVTFTTAPPSGDVYIYSNPLYTQQTGFSSGQAYSPTVVNDALDRAVVRDLDLRRRIGQAILVPDNEAGVDLPPASDRAGKVIGFDANGGLTLVQPSLTVGEAQQRWSFDVVAASQNDFECDGSAGLALDVLVNGVDQQDFSQAGDMVTLTNAAVEGDKVLIKAVGGFALQLQSRAKDVTYSALTPAPPGTVAATLRRTINIKDAPFNAPMNGADDDTPALLAAEAWLAANGRGTLHIPEGTLYLPNGVTLTQSGITYQFEGQGGSTIVTNGGTGDVVSLGDGSANPNDILLSGFSVRSLVQKTGGASIRMRNGHNLRAEKFRLNDGLYDGVRFDAGAEQYIYQIDDFEINGGHRGIWVPDNVTGIVQELFVGQGIIAACDEEGVLIEQGSGLYFTGGTLSVLQCKKGVSLAPANGKGVVASWFVNVIADTCDEAGWWIVPPGTGQIRDIVFDNIWASGNGTAVPSHGIHIDQVAGGIHGLTFNSPRAIFNARHGIFVGGSNRVEINGPKVSLNNQENAGYAGIKFSTAGINGVRVSGGHGWPLSVAGSGETQEYTIDIDIGDGSTVLIDGMDVRAGVTANIVDNSTGATIVNCLGYKTKAKGNATLTSGNSTKLVAHGLAEAPTINDVFIEPTSSLAAASVTQIRVTAADATNFEVTTVGGAAAADILFKWRAAIKGA